MEENVKKQVIEQVHALITAPSVTPQLKQVAQDWLSAVDTEGEDLQTRSLIAELSADVNTIDEVIPFFASAFAKQHFGEEQAAVMYAQAQKVKADGGTFCFCPACTAGVAILRLIGPRTGVFGQALKEAFGEA